MAATSRLTALTLLTLQLLIILVFAVFVDYESLSVSSATFPTLSNSTKDMMMFVLLGFGVIMTYLRSHRWSSAAFTLLISALAVEYYILWSFLWDSVASSNFTRFVTFTQEKFIRGLYATAAILVGYGAFLGRVGPFELVITVLIQVIGYSCNQMLCGPNYLNCFDVGRGMQVHLFGAAFGIMVALLLSRDGVPNNPKMSGSYRSTAEAFVGCLFLWVYYPSFNSCLSQASTQSVAYSNTIFSLISSTVAAFLFCMLYHDRLRLRDVMFASLSGAVAISSGANLIINIGGVMLCSFFVGWISLSGYAYFSRFFNIYGLYDVAGINNLHGIPGLISGIYSAIFISVYTAGLNYLGISTIKGTRTNYEQGAYQIACLATSLAFGLAFGAITGSILRRLALYHKDQLFEDKSFWEILPAEQDYDSTPPRSNSNKKAVQFNLELSNIEQSFIKSPLAL